MTFGKEALGAGAEVLNDRATTAEIARETAKKVLGLSPRQKEENK